MSSILLTEKTSLWSVYLTSQLQANCTILFKYRTLVIVSFKMRSYCNNNIIILYNASNADDQWNLNSNNVVRSQSTNILEVISTKVLNQ